MREKLVRHCKKCGQEKPHHRDKSTKDGIKDWCIDCRRNGVAKFRRISPEKHKEYKHRERAKRYGLKPEQLTELLLNAEDRCAICKDFTLDLVIDHDHDRNEVRGVLCGRCNIGLGQFRNSPILCKVAADYLEDYWLKIGRE